MTGSNWEHALHARAASGAGSHRGNSDQSISQLLSSLIPFFVIGAVCFVLFLIFQKKLQRVYAPRTYLSNLNKDERTQDRAPGMFGWSKTLSKLEDETVLERSSIDNYLWLRFFKMLTLMSFVGCLITWPILFPVNATGGGGQSGLNILTFSNVTPGPRQIAHSLVAWVYLGFVMLLITRETVFFVQVRQAYFLSPFMTSRISSKTVLFTDVPETHRDEQYLRRIFPKVRNVWKVKDVQELEDSVQERDDAATKLETGENTLIQNYVKKQLKARKKGGDDHEPVEIDSKDRPTHKMKPIIGSKVDTINWSRGELQRLIPSVSQEQHARVSNDLKNESAIFIEFESVAAAQIAFQQTPHRNALNMTPADIGMTPEEVNWKALGKSWGTRKIISWASTTFIILLVMFWTIPVAFVGVLSNIDALIREYSWLSWLQAVPDTIFGVISSLLPTILLVILMALVPIICNALGALFEPTLGKVQLKTQAWYFIFQVIQVFLITTFSSGAVAVGQKIANDPTQAPTLLSRNLPKASNFYYGYFIYFGIITAGVQLLNIAPLLFFSLIGKFTDKTPRKQYNRYITLAGLGWGALYPKFTNLGVIALSYSCIAPLVLGFATIGFALLYFAFRYNAFFTLGTTVSTRGRAYSRALQQLTVGLYLSEVCLIGLFGSAAGGGILSIVALALMVILLIVTIFWQVQLQKVMGPLVETLPADLLAEEYENLHGERSSSDHTRNGAHDNAQNGKPNNAGDAEANGEKDKYYQIPQPKHADTAPPQPPSGIMGRVKVFFQPQKYSSASTLSKYILSPHLSEAVRPYSDEERRQAYLHPALVAEAPVVWIAKDEYGLSKREIGDSKEVVGEGLEITDEGTYFDEKGRAKWDEGDIQKAPIWEERVLY